MSREQEPQVLDRTWWDARKRLPKGDVVTELVNEVVDLNRRINYLEKLLKDAQVWTPLRRVLSPPATLRDFEVYLRQFRLRRRRVGVYFLMRNDEIMYVGQSTDIDGRIRSHVQQQPSFDSVFWVQASKSISLNDLESALIRYIQPPWNRTGVHPMREEDRRVIASLIEGRFM